MKQMLLIVFVAFLYNHLGDKGVKNMILTVSQNLTLFCKILEALKMEYFVIMINVAE